MRYAKRAFRRRYASRTNFDKLFSQYDKDGKGFVDARDLHEQAGKIGMGLSLDEAQVLVRHSCKLREDGVLGLDQGDFEKFLFAGGDDDINVNLKELKPLSPHEAKSVAKSALAPQPTSQNETQNQWKFYLQKCIKNVSNDLSRSQEFKNDQIDSKYLLKVIGNQSQIPEGLKYNNNDDLVAYVNQYLVEGTNRVDYGKLVVDLNNFDYVASIRAADGLAVPKSNSSVRSGLTDAVGWQEPKSIFDDEYVVLDLKKVPQNTIEQIERKMIKVNRKIKNIFPVRADLEKKVAEKLEADGNKNISVDQLRDFVLEICHDDMVAQKIFKRDIEGFLSGFNYNNYGATNVDSVAKTIFTRDDLIPDKLAEVKRANAPPSDLSKNVDVAAVDAQQPHNSRIRSLINQMEDKVFDGKVKLYQVFKKFDKDGDGYVSYEDFENCLKAIKVDASKDEMAQMLKLIDKKGNGHLNFTDFSQVFRPDMSTVLTSIPQNDIYHNN